ncbi:MAG: phosphatase PAP2 family protein [Chitinophagaceae bacterium]|jgi:membrane-associated phospholipid phosphatase|nr:phosphatase PAP2 family protein [Chitinophagaceae bacterium]
MNNQLNYKNFAIAATITAVASLLLFYCSYAIGKNEFFLLLNNNYGTTADIFFTIFTYLGDGAIWAVLLFVFIKYSKQNIPLLIAAFVICTLLVQVCKYVIIPDAFRPIKAIAATHLIHIVKGMEPHETASFPSGHTSAAFSFFLIGCLLIHKKWIVPIGFIYAILVGYSRVCLAQHFPFDVAAGMLVGIITVGLSILIQQWLNKKKLIKSSSV